MKSLEDFDHREEDVLWGTGLLGARGAGGKGTMEGMQGRACCSPSPAPVVKEAFAMHSHTPLLEDDHFQAGSRNPIHVHPSVWVPFWNATRLFFRNGRAKHGSARTALRLPELAAARPSTFAPPKPSQSSDIPSGRAVRCARGCQAPSPHARRLWAPAKPLPPRNVKAYTCSPVGPAVRVEG